MPPSGGTAAFWSALLPMNATLEDVLRNASQLEHDAVISAFNITPIVSVASPVATATSLETITDAERDLNTFLNDEVLIYDHSPGTVAYLVVQLVVVFENAILFMIIGFGCLAFAVSPQNPPSPPGVKGGDESDVVVAKDEAPPQTCCCLIPALLDHEASIIVETVVRALAVPQVAKVILTYNTKAGDPIADKLRVFGVAETLRRLELLRAEDPRLIILNNADSTSKAANLNAALPLTAPYEQTLIIDADHHITDEFVARLAHALQRAPDKVACMQGAVLVRGNSIWEATLCTLNWYFFSILFPAYQMIAGTATFAGAGAMWRSSILRDLGFVDGMVCEDDELSMRTMLAGYDIHVCPRAEVTELAPESIHSFFAQRLRWTYGYEQSFNRHAAALTFRRPRAMLQRLYVYAWQINGILWVTSVVIYLMARPRFSIWMGILPPIFTILPTSILVVVALCTMLKANGWKRWRSTVLLMPVSAIYGNAQLLLTIWARLRMMCGFEWKATRRKLPPPT